MLTDGREIYPHYLTLHVLPFWKCDACGNFVGCHHKTKNRTRPLGCIPTPEIRGARRHIHTLLDSVWKSGKIKRSEIYKRLSDELGWEYHTARLQSVGEARKAYRIIQRLVSGTENGKGSAIRNELVGPWEV